MHSSKIEIPWIKSFVQQFSACGINRGSVVAILCETQSRPEIVLTSRIALQQMEASVFLIEMPTPPQTERVPLRSTGASGVVHNLAAVITALSRAEIVIDCTVEGMLHAPELPEILAGGTRLLMISNEHPEILERLGTDPSLEARVKKGIARIGNANHMRVTSDVGTDLDVMLAGSPTGGNWGYCKEAGSRSHWPGGLVLAFPRASSVNGTLVFSPGDANLTFKRYFESIVTVKIEQDYITRIEGQGLDAELLRSYLSAWNDRDAYAVSHVGWGMNERARWDSMIMYDKADFNGTELRAFAGNFLFSTGANEQAGRFTKGHFDFPMRNCTISLDGEVVVERGVLQGDMSSSL